jgi:hypothetical protein
MERTAQWAALCGVACLALAAAASGAETKYDGAYAGKRTLAKGASRPLCC